MYDDIPRRTLVDLVRRYGTDLSLDPERIEALLQEQCGSYRREIRLLVDAGREGVPAQLLDGTSTTPQSARVTQLTKALEDELGLQHDAARWAVETWSAAVGVVDPSNLSAGQRSHGLPAWRRTAPFAAIILVALAAAVVAINLGGLGRTFALPASGPGVAAPQLGSSNTPAASATQQPALAADARARPPADWKTVAAGAVASVLPAGAFTTAPDLGIVTWKPVGDKVRFDIKSNYGLHEPLSLGIPTGEKFLLSVDVQQIAGDGTAFYGLLFHAQPPSDPRRQMPYYGIMANDRGFFRAVQLRESGWLKFIPPRPFTNMFAGKVNHLAVRGDGSQYLLFVNDHLEGEFTNGDLTAGFAGVEVDAMDEAAHKSFTIEFGNYEVRAPQ